MKTVYSHSKLSLFESCPEAYKIKYIDKTFPDLPLSIHLFLGSEVHEALEWLYQEKDFREIELDDLIEYFIKNWKDKYSDEIRITEGDEEVYFNRGIKFLVDYYQKYKPFSENTVEIEKKILFPLDEEHFIQGYVDRIVLKGDKYEVHDYKTNQRIKSQEEVDEDRQLAFYHLGLQELFGQEIKVDLIWHFLAFNEKVVSTRTGEELEKLRKDTLALIEKIENNSEWNACGSKWCDWCAYKKIEGL